MSTSNRPLLIMTVGLPRSGKSTWCLEKSRKYGIPIVCPDSVRLAIHGHDFISLAEPLVWAHVKIMVRALVLAGHEYLILDATNIGKIARDSWISDSWDRTFKVFTTPYEICIKRAEESNRLDLIPVIRRMTREYEPISLEEIKTSVDFRLPYFKIPSNVVVSQFKDGE